jgi:transcriptional regulator with XRE-family HTH domain
MPGMNTNTPWEAHEEIRLLIEFLMENYHTSRGGKKLSQIEIGKRIGVDPSTLSKAKSPDNYANVSEEKRRDIIASIKRVFDVQVYFDKESGKYDFAFIKGQSSINSKELELLAGKLALNLVDVSTPFRNRSKPHLEILQNEKTIKLRSESSKKERFIVVVGAGASNAATKGYMKTASAAANQIRESIQKNKTFKELVEKELRRLRLVYQLREDEFETQLLAFSKYCPEEVLGELRKLTSLKFVPSLAYEILGHMLKHRLVDVIINFNFDEILDRILQEEMNDGDYRFIFSDGDCPNSYEDLLVGNRLKQPVYIKPHGTISYKSSLRFTREDYFAMPSELRDTMSSIIEAKVPDPAQEQLLVNLIVIGFRMQSFQFNELLKDYLQDVKKMKLKLWIFDLDPDGVEENFLSTFQDDEQDLKDRIIIEKINLNGHNLEKHMVQLWNMIEADFKLYYKPRGIERHLMINEIFNFGISQIKKLDTNHSYLQNYFKDRFFVELAISLLQSDGILNINQIMESRSGDYFRQYKRSLGKMGEETNLRSMCKEFGMETYKGFVWDTYVFGEPESFYTDTIFEKLYDTLRDKLQVTTLNMDLKDFKKMAQGIKKRNLLKVNPNFENPHNHLFNKIQNEDIFITTTSWIYHYRKAIKRTNKWDLLLSISEKGRFLPLSPEEMDLYKGKKIELVLSSFDTPDFPNKEGELLKGYNLLSGKPLYLPWWLHNQHMVLLLKRKERNSKNILENFEYFEGFYYTSRLLSRRLNAVRVRKKEDLITLLYIFVNYWYRAKSYTDNMGKRDRSVPIISNKDEIDEYIADLLCLYDKGKK